MKEFMRKKVRGVSDLIASIIAIMALTIFTFAYVLFTGDVFTKINISQVVRAYTYRMESQGTLTDTDIANMKSDFLSIKEVNKATGGSAGAITVIWNNGSVPNGTTIGHGNKLTLYVDVPAVTTEYSAGDPSTGEQTLFGSIKRTKVVHYTMNKETTAKY